MSNEDSSIRFSKNDIETLEHAADEEEFMVVPDLEQPGNDNRHSNPDNIGLIDEYRLIKKVGSGGSSNVYLAESVGRGSGKFAVKVFNRSIHDTVSRVRFNRETNALQRLDHPNIAKLVDFGLTAEAHPYIVFEYIDGDRIDVFCSQENPSFHVRAALLATACSALQHAHDQGIIHRDIKPGNIIVSRTGEPFLTDFGLSKLFEDNSPDAEKTRTGTVLGTLNFLAPEQLFATKNNLSSKTDIFGIGAVLHVLLVGRPPFQFGNVVEAATTYFKRLPVRLECENAPEPLKSICIQCLSANPQDRYPTARAVEVELRRFLDGKTVRAKRPTLRQKYSLLLKQYPLLSRGIPMLLLVLVVFSGVVLGLLKKSQDELMRANKSNQQLSDSMQDFSLYVRSLEESPETLDIRRGLLQMICDTLTKQEEQFAQRPELLFQSAVAEYKLADLEGYKGNNNTAKELRAKARDKFAQLVLMDPNHEKASVGLFQSLLWLGEYEFAHDEIERLVNRFPDNHDYQESLCTTKLLIGDTYIAHFEFDKTRPHYESARLIAEGLPGVVPNVNFSRRRAFSSIASARLAVLDGELELASQLVLDAIEIYEELDPLSLSTHGETDEYLKCIRLALSISAFCGDDTKVQEHLAQATQFYNLAMEQFSSYVQIHGTYCRILEDYSAHCFNIGDTEGLLRTKNDWNRVVGNWQKLDEGSVDFCNEKLSFLEFPFFPKLDVEHVQKVRDELISLNSRWSGKNINLGRAYLLAGDLDNASPFFEGLVKLEPLGVPHRAFQEVVRQLGLGHAGEFVVDDTTRRQLLAATMSYHASLLEETIRKDLEIFNSTNSQLQKPQP